MNRFQMNLTYSGMLAMIKKTWKFKNNPPTGEEINMAIRSMRDEFIELYGDDPEITEKYMPEVTPDEKNNCLHMTLVPRYR